MLCFSKNILHHIYNVFFPFNFLGDSLFVKGTANQVVVVVFAVVVVVYCSRKGAPVDVYQTLEFAGEKQGCCSLSCIKNFPISA